MLDGLSPLWRHLVLMLAATMLAWAGTDVVPVLAGRPGLAGVAGSVLMILVNLVTPLTRQYGVGQRREPEPARRV